MADRPPEVPALTPLRGIAASAVLLSHGNLAAVNDAGGTFSWAQYHGYLAVDLFFFLSGFVLTHVYGSDFAGERSWTAVRAFLWARFCRIYPALLFTTAMFVMVFIPGRVYLSDGYSLTGQLAGNIFLMQVPWLTAVIINQPSWSISAEFYAYLCFPFMVPVICGFSLARRWRFGSFSWSPSPYFIRC